MKQFSFEYSTQPQLISNLNSVANWAHKSNISNIWIQVYVMEESTKYLSQISDAISLCIPDAKYMITHAGMGFASGLVNSATAVIVCNIFEEKDTRIELIQYPFSPVNFEKTTDAVIEYVKANPWIKLISFNCGSALGGVKSLNRLAQSVNPDIVMFGGAAATASMAVPAYVMSSDGPMSTDDIVISYIGGENFHAKADVIVGWKGIGKEFTITKSEGALISEIDNRPAFDVYRKYFKIECDPGLVVGQTIEFPLCFVDGKYFFVRCPLLLNPDGSIVMMMDDLYEGQKVRLSFGAPDVILDELVGKLNEMAKFEPQFINVNSCLGRNFFWGDKISTELSMFEKAAPAGGYLTGGEILRDGNRMLIFNESIIITGMREGEASADGSKVRIVEREKDDYSLTLRLSSFIDTVTSDLEERNNEMKQMAITDALTGLFNRREIENQIETLCNEKAQFSILLMDIDYFKYINDTYGHKEGDNVICLLSELIKKLASGREDIIAGRWGGDEFLIAFKNDTAETAVEFAKELQKCFYSEDVYANFKRSLSIGVASSEYDADTNSIFQRADEKLYQAKAQGKSRIIY